MTIKQDKEKKKRDGAPPEQPPCTVETLDAKEEQRSEEKLVQPVSVATALVVPMVYDWYSGMRIVDAYHKEWMRVKFVRSRKFFLSGPTGMTDYTYRQVGLSKPDGQMAAFITTKFQPGSLANWIHFAAYAFEPQYPEQEAISLVTNPEELGYGYVPDGMDEALGPLYPYGKFVATDVWKDIYSLLKCTGTDEHEEVLQISKSTIRRLTVNKLLGCCVPCLCWRKVLVEGQTTDGAEIILERDEKKESVFIREGHCSPLDALVVAFATDHMFYGCAPNCPCT